MAFVDLSSLGDCVAKGFCASVLIRRKEGRMDGARAACPGACNLLPFTVQKLNRRANCPNSATYGGRKLPVSNDPAPHLDVVAACRCLIMITANHVRLQLFALAYNLGNFLGKMGLKLRL